MKIGECKIEAVVVIDFISTPREPNNVKFHIENLVNKGEYTTNSSFKISFPKKEYIPVKGDKIYFNEGCTVLRDKVRTIGKEKEFSITIKKESANIHVVHDEVIMNLIDPLKDYYQPVICDDFINFIKCNYSNLDDFKDLFDIINKPDITKVLISTQVDNYQKAFISRAQSTMYDDYTIKGKELGVTKIMYDINPNGYSNYTQLSRYHTYFISDDNIKYIDDLINNTNVYHQDSIINMINNDSIVINGSRYEQLDRMFNSGQESNFQVGMELLANCNINKSMHFILLLFKDHYSKMLAFNCSKHVNFKSLVNYINHDNSLSYITYDSLIKKLMNMDILDLKVLRELMPYLKASMVNGNYLGESFKIDTIVCSDEIINFIKDKSNKDEQSSTTIN